MQHCRESIERWKQRHPPAREIQHLEIIRGNALQIAADQGEALLGFDRIYVGAAIDKSGLAQMKRLLKPGGVLVAPGKLTEEGTALQLAAATCLFVSPMYHYPPLLSG